ncbi:arginine/serine-rich coiled-coil protein 2-like isoform X4 [Euwallacea similis]|uniref:arginine/serine-rich coiled-coil protein 2-like isoform X4 n=1 Tax=Euwallacea similis TaxID=1736056 RepID=UPI00344DF8F7
MNSLMSYGNDDSSDESGDEKFLDSNDSSSNQQATPSSGSRPNHSSHSYNRSSLSSSSQRFSAVSDCRSASRSPKFRREDERRRDDRHRVDNRRQRRDDRRDSRDDDRDRARDRGYERRRDDRSNRDRRERRRSRDHRRSRSPRKSPKRSRSGSRGPRGFPSRKEKADKRMDRLDKLGIEFKPDNYPASAIEEAELKSTQGDRFFVPGITGRFRDQIEKRKLLWHKAKEEDSTAVAKPSTTTASLAMGAGSKSSKVYEATTFADDKTSSKFKRLMGIRETDTSNLPVKSTDVLKKQQEMFTSMEAQYEVARTATHTMRGVGLGFGSLQR